MARRSCRSPIDFRSGLERTVKMLLNGPRSDLWIHPLSEITCSSFRWTLTWTCRTPPLVPVTRTGISESNPCLNSTRSPIWPVFMSVWGDLHRQDQNLGLFVGDDILTSVPAYWFGWIGPEMGNDIILTKLKMCLSSV